MSALAWIATQLTAPAQPRVSKPVEVSHGARLIAETVEQEGALTYPMLVRVTGYADPTVRRWANEAAAADLVELEPGYKGRMWVKPKGRAQ